MEKQKADLYSDTLKHECARHWSGEKIVLGTIFVEKPMIYNNY